MTRQKDLIESLKRIEKFIAKELEIDISKVSSGWNGDRIDVWITEDIISRHKPYNKKNQII